MGLIGQHPMRDDVSTQKTLDAMERAFLLARNYIASLRERPVSLMASPDTMRAALVEPLPELGSDPCFVAEEWFERAKPGIVASAGPRFFGFVVGGVTPGALAGDWLASAIDQLGGIWLASPAAAQTELVVIDWLKALFGLPQEWVGTLTSGATQSNLIGLAAGRQWVGEQLGFDPASDGLAGQPPIPVISSKAIHVSARKALSTLGFGRQAVTAVDAPGGRIDIDQLATALAATDGPAIVVANAGEVNTGQFDDLTEVARICRQHEAGVWLHVDGAFGIFAGASPSVRDRIAGIEAVQSVAGDGHKWLNVPYDCGMAFVRDEAVLRRTFAASGEYLTGGGGWDADDFGPEFSRRFRGLAVWCALKSLGRQGYQDLVERSLEHARQFATWVDQHPALELMNRERMLATPFNIVCFRAVADGESAEAADARNQTLVSTIQHQGQAFVTGTTWVGKRAVRAAFDNWSTTEADRELLQDAVEAALQEL